MSLLHDLRLYTNTKNNTDFNHRKKVFFNEIIHLLEDNQLTASTLTDKLVALTDAERSQLFYLRRRQGPSSSSKAAQWILTLYNALNIPVNDLALATIVAEGLNVKNQQTLKQYAYKSWQANKLSLRNISILEHELKGQLGISSKENRQLPLAISMKNYFDTHGFSELKNMLLSIAEFSPDYLPEIISKLAEEYQDNYELIGELKQIALENSVFVPYFLKTNSSIAAALVEDNESCFFQLPTAMQQAILTKLDSATLSHLYNYDEEDELKEAFIRLLANEGMLQAASKKSHPEHHVFTQLHQTIRAKLPENGVNLANEHQKNLAIQAINRYLEQEPGAYKYQFFNALKEDIQYRGLTTDLLQRHLQATLRQQLFAKWSGVENSRALALMKDLYNKATFGHVLDDNQTREMINTGTLPSCSIEEISRGQYRLISKKVTRILLHPEEARFTALGQEIQKNLHYYQSFHRIKEQQIAQSHQRAEAIYQQYLIEKGLEQALTSAPAFDPQGHVIVTVELDDNDFNAIAGKITGTEWPRINANILARLIGAENISLRTVCNLDIAEHEELKERFKGAILHYNDESFETVSLALDALLASPHRSSVISLQEEMFMHVSLSLRVLEKTLSDKLNEFSPLTEEERNELFQQINYQVLKNFNEALQKSFTLENGIDFARLNEELDKARSLLAPKCRELLVKKLLSHIGPWDRYQISDILSTLTDNDFTHSTATGLDYLRTDATNHTVVRISGTDYTAHAKDVGPQKQALRLLSRNHYEANTVKPYAQPTREARVPSLDVINRANYPVISDIAAKLKYSRSVLTNKDSRYQGPMVYNLLTSLHTKAYDYTLFENKNKQRQGARRILLGSHLFNLQQVKQSASFNLVYVQNIPVNQHTNQLDNAAFDDTTAEATLMTDMALMSTFDYYSELFSPALRESIAATFANAHSAYVSFLKTRTCNYFKDSAQGKYVIAEMAKKKILWANVMEKFPEKSHSLQTRALHALFKMVVTNDYHNKQFGMLAQSLSVFLEPLSQAGCKSANERYQAVAGRVELLKSINETAELPPIKQAVFDSLRSYIQGEASVGLIQERLDSAYNQCNLQGAAAVFSEEDQGASSKVKATANRHSSPGRIAEFDTNVAESGYLTLLFQKFSSAMQAHKAHLASVFKALFTSKIEEAPAQVLMEPPI